MKILTLIGLILVLILILAAGVYYIAKTAEPKTISEYNPTNSNPSIEMRNTQPQEFFINITGSRFYPSTITITESSTVVWTNTDPMSHTIISDSGNELDSGEIRIGGSYSHTFDSLGMYDYHCSIHPSMKGKIIVE